MQLKINIWWLAAGIAILGCFFLLFRGCYKPEKAAQAEVIVVDTTLVAELKQRAAIAEAKTEAAVAKKDSILKDLARAQLATRNWAVKYSEARSKKDTVLSFERCDSLANEVEVLNGTLDEYKKSYDEVVEAQRVQVNACDSIAALQADFIAQYRNLYIGAANDRNSLAIQLNKEQRKTKREKLLTRVLAGLVIVAGGYAAMK